jgi:hypothetical protein
MATAKSIRLGPVNAGSRRQMPPRSPRHGGNGSTTSALALRAEQCKQITLVALRLRAIYGIAVTAERALRLQSAEQDPEIADCLRVGVCDPIADQIRALQELTEHRGE